MKLSPVSRYVHDINQCGLYLFLRLILSLSALLKSPQRRPLTSSIPTLPSVVLSNRGYISGISLFLSLLLRSTADRPCLFIPIASHSFRSSLYLSLSLSLSLTDWSPSRDSLLTGARWLCCEHLTLTSDRRGAIFGLGWHRGGESERNRDRYP